MADSMSTATVTSKGQITIPKAIRERLGIHEGDRVAFRVAGGGTVTMAPADPPRLGRVPGLLRHLGREQPVTIEEMDAAVADQMHRKHGAGQR